MKDYDRDYPQYYYFAYKPFFTKKNIKQPHFHNNYAILWKLTDGK